MRSSKSNKRPKRKGTQVQTAIYKTLQRKLKIEQHEPTKNRGELRCSGRVNSSDYSNTLLELSDYKIFIVV
jgi:hypothetical protein